MSSTSTLPPELHDYIVDFLFDDKSALSSCSLVSREWRTTSQYHLFHTIQVVHPTSITALDDILQNSPHLANSIRDLTLRGSGATNGTCFDDQMVVTTRDVFTCVSRLPRLASISVDGMWWNDTLRSDEKSVSATPQVALRTPPSLRSFSARKVFTTPGALLDTLCMFPAIGHLDMERVYWIYGIDRPEPCPLLPKQKPSLGGLRVGPGSTYNMLRCFLPLVEERMDISALDSLAIEFEHFDAWQELVAFLQTVSPHLRQLSLKFGKYAISNESSGPQLKDLKLSSLSALQSFEVHLPGEDINAAHPPRSWALLHSLLVLLPSSLCDLTVVHKMHLEGLQSRLSNVEWGLVDDLLAGPSFGALGDVTIRTELAAPGCGMDKETGFYCFSSDDLWDYLEDNHERTQVFLKEKLPQLEARGILSIQ